MLSSTALGVPRFSIIRDRRSSSTRSKSFPKFARPRKAETTIVPFLPVAVVLAINTPFQLSELYSLTEVQSASLLADGSCGSWRRLSLPHVRPRSAAPAALCADERIALVMTPRVLLGLCADFKQLVRGLLSFGHWTPSPQSQARSAADALLQSIDLAAEAERLGMDGAYFRGHHFAQQLA